MMISISVAIASDYLAGNFAAWGRGVFTGVDTHGQVRRGGERAKETVRREREKERELGLLINKPRDWRYLPSNPTRGRFIN